MPCFTAMNFRLRTRRFSSRSRPCATISTCSSPSMWRRPVFRQSDLNSPLNAVFHGDEFQIADQAFQFQESTLRDHLHVLLAIDVEKTGFSPNRRILPVRMADKDFPVTR